jgi:hypothetical protein
MKSAPASCHSRLAAGLLVERKIDDAIFPIMGGSELCRLARSTPAAWYYADPRLQ